MLAFYLRVLRAVPGVIWDAAGKIGTLGLIVATAVLAFNRQLASHIVGWNGFPPVWAIVPSCLLIVYGLATAIYAEARLFGATNTAQPTVVQNFYGPVNVNVLGTNSAQTPQIEAPRAQGTQTEPEDRR